MSEGMGVEDRIALWMVEDAPDDAPRWLIDSALERTRSMPQERLVRHPPRVSRGALVAAAIMILVASLATVALIGGWLAQTPAPSLSPDALERLQSAGVIRLAVRPSHPQATLGNGTLDGFDVDVAHELGRRLGLSVEVVELSPAEMFERPGEWDVGLPSTPDWTVDPTGYATSTAYYAWPHLLLVPAGSGATSVADVQGQPICAVAGDAGQAWLMGTYGGANPSVASTPPIPSTLILRSSDAECIAELADGQVRGMVTATLTPSEIAALGDLRAIDGPLPEPRAAVVVAGADTASLVAALDRAIEAARADGTLAEHSLTRFGSDLTSTSP